MNLLRTHNFKKTRKNFLVKSWRLPFLKKKYKCWMRFRCEWAKSLVMSDGGDEAGDATVALRDC